MYRKIWLNVELIKNKNVSLLNFLFIGTKDVGIYEPLNDLQDRNSIILFFLLPADRLKFDTLYKIVVLFRTNQYQSIEIFFSYNQFENAFITKQGCIPYFQVWFWRGSLLFFNSKVDNGVLVFKIQNLKNKSPIWEWLIHLCVNILWHGFNKLFEFKSDDSVTIDLWKRGDNYSQCVLCA